MTLAIHAAKPAARVPHSRVEALWNLGRSMKASTITVARVDGRSAEPLLVLPLTEDRVQIESCVICAQDEAASLEKGINHPFVFFVSNENGNEIARERIRFPGNREPIVRAMSQGEADQAGIEGDAHGGTWPSKFHPRETASIYGIARQQMRHTEAMAGLMVKFGSTIAEGNRALVDKLQDRVELLTDKTIKQADAVIGAHSQNRLIEAQARREEVETEALRATAQVLAEWLPLGIHRIARKYGLAGDSELDPMLERIVETFKPDQIDKLKDILEPAQKAIFAEMWMKVADRREKRDKDKAEKAAASAGAVDKMTGTKANGAGANGAANGEKKPDEPKT